MIDSRELLYEYLNIEKNICKENGYKGKFHSFITKCEIGEIARFLRILRLDEYYSNTAGKNLLKIILSLYYRRKHNKLGIKLGISIPINTFGKGLTIYHSQGIIVHEKARCGDFCKIHGIMCIGNNGCDDLLENVPILGNDVDIGIGALIIGPIRLADNIKVAGGAVVCRSCLESGTTLIGIPAKAK